MSHRDKIKALTLRILNAMLRAEGGLTPLYRIDALDDMRAAIDGLSAIHKSLAEKEEGAL